MTHKGQLGQALVDAVMLRDKEKVVDLLKCHADMNYQTKGDMAIHLAARNGDFEILSALIEAGDDVNKCNQNGNTATHFASRNGREALIRYLKTRGADLNIQNKDGDTPLHFCVGCQPMDTIECFVKFGMKVNIQNKRGQKAYQVAREESISELLKMHSLLKSAKEKGCVMAEGTRLNFAETKLPKFFKRVGITLESISNTEHSSLSFFCRREKIENKSVTFVKDEEHEVVSDVFHFRVRDVIADIKSTFTIPLYCKPSEKQELALNVIGQTDTTIISDIVECNGHINCSIDLVLVPEETTIIVVCLRPRVQSEVIGESAGCIVSELEKEFRIDIPEESFEDDTEINLKVYDLQDGGVLADPDKDVEPVCIRTIDPAEDKYHSETIDDQDTETLDKAAVIGSVKSSFKSRYNISIKLNNKTETNMFGENTVVFERKKSPKRGTNTLLSDVFQVDLSGNQPSKSIKLQVPLCDDTKKLGIKDIKVLRIDDGGNNSIKEVNEKTNVEGSNVVFETDHFSTFVVCPFRCADLSKIYADIINVKQRRQEARFFAMVRTLEDKTTHILVVECIRSQLSSKRRKHWRSKLFEQQKPKHSSKIMLAPSQEFSIQLTGDAQFDKIRGESGLRTIVFSPHRASYQPFQVILSSAFKDGKASVQIMPTNQLNFDRIDRNQENAYLETRDSIKLDIMIPLPPDSYGTDMEDALKYDAKHERSERLRERWLSLVNYLYRQFKQESIKMNIEKYNLLLEKRRKKIEEEEKRRVEAEKLKKKRTPFPTDILQENR